MRNQKRRTNQTYTKRVDHEAGRHRRQRAMPEPAICKLCGDVYSNRRWSKAYIEANRTEAYTVVICPACRIELDGKAGGYLHLDGSFLTDHREEIERLLQNEVERTSKDNPLARIIGWEVDNKGRLTALTTTEHLVQRLGHALEKAFSGKVRYDFSHENKLAHVYWHRD